MCGIFVYIGPRDDAPQIAFEGIKLLEYRGYDSWGVGYIPKNKSRIIYEKHTGKIGSAKLNKTSPSGVAFAHTRWATHGGVTDLNAHPHFDCERKIAVIHNGIVENYKELKSELLKKGHKFLSETDTEVISHLTEENCKNLPFNEAVFKTFNTLAGSNAICVMDTDSRTVTACRNGSPLVIGIDKKNRQYFLGSDVPAFLRHTNNVYFMNDNEGVTLNESGVKVFNLKTLRQKYIKTNKLDWKLEDAEKGGFPHFLLKEIYEQKTTIGKTAKINYKEIRKLAELIKTKKNIILVGCGTASYCALAGKYFFAKMGIETQNYGSYEFSPFLNSVNKKAVVIGISQSGETADTLIALRAAKERGAHIAAIVNTRGSTMERLADTLIPVGAGPEIAVVSTKAFTSQLATLYLLSKAIKGDFKSGQKEISDLSESINKFLNKNLERKIIKIAKILFEKEHAFVIGKHINYPAALEFALKTKEAAYIHSEAFTAGELKHGVITLIQKGTPCFTLTANDEVRDEVLSAAAELKARGAYIIGVSPFTANEFDETVPVPDLGTLSIFPNVIVGQLLGYFLGVGRGNDPDKPRNLAKSVTVK